MSEAEDWLGPATDLLRQYAFDDAARALEDAPDREGRHTRAVMAIEGLLIDLLGRPGADLVDAGRPPWSELIGAVAEHLLRTPAETLDLLRGLALRRARRPGRGPSPPVLLPGGGPAVVREFLRRNGYDPATQDHVVYRLEGPDRRREFHTLIPRGEPRPRPTIDGLMGGGWPWPALIV